MKRNWFYSMIRDDPEGQTGRVKPSEYLLEIDPQEAIAELKAYIESMEDDLRQSSQAFSDEDLEILENFEKVRKLSSELEIAQNYLAHLKKTSKSIKYLDLEKDNIDWLALGPELLGEVTFDRTINEALTDMTEHEVVAEAEACFQSGNRNFDLGHYQEAIQAYKDAIRINPECHEAYFNLGLAYCMLGHYQEAVQAYKKCLLMKRNDAKAYTCLGKTYVELGDHNEAAEAFEAAIRIEPGCPDAHSNLGRAYNSLKRYEEAVQVLMEAIRIKPDHAEAHNNLGWAYGGLRRYAKAAEAFKEAIRIKPDYDEAHFGLGTIYALFKDWDSALEEYEILKDLSVYLADKFLKLIKKWWLIFETSDEVVKESEFDDVSFDDMTLEQSEMLFDRMGFEIKARLTKFLADLGAERLKEHFYSIDRMVEDMKQGCFIRKGTIY